MPDRLVEIGWTLTLWVTVPVVILGMLYCFVTMVRERRAVHTCYTCGYIFRPSLFKAGTRCPRCNGMYVYK